MRHYFYAITVITMTHCIDTKPAIFVYIMGLASKRSPSPFSYLIYLPFTAGVPVVKSLPVHILSAVYNFWSFGITEIIRINLKRKITIVQNRATLTLLVMNRLSKTVRYFHLFDAFLVLK